MDKDKRKSGVIERGEIIKSEDGNYTIQSFDRIGIITAPLKPLQEEEAFSIGDRVFYFYFKDGTGRIICKL